LGVGLQIGGGHKIGALETKFDGIDNKLNIGLAVLLVGAAFYFGAYVIK
jgi:hypothetical protein